MKSSCVVAKCFFRLHHEGCRRPWGEPSCDQDGLGLWSLGALGPSGEDQRIVYITIDHHDVGGLIQHFFWEKPWCPSLEWLRWWKVSWAVGLCWIYDIANDRTVDGVYKPTFLTGWRHLGWRGTSEAFFTRLCDVQFWKTLGRQNSWKW